MLGTLDLNKIIIKRKVQNRLSEFLNVCFVTDTEASVTYINSYLLSYLFLAWVKSINGKIIKFGDDINGETKQKVDLSLQIETYKERF